MRRALERILDVLLADGRCVPSASAFDELLQIPQSMHSRRRTTRRRRNVALAQSVDDVFKHFDRFGTAYRLLSQIRARAVQQGQTSLAANRFNRFSIF
jgi:hypothetical protein